MKVNDKKAREYVFVIILGAISGSFVGEIFGSTFKSLEFLGKCYSIGLSKPFILDLKVISLTLGFGININLMSIICVILAIILFRRY